MILIESYIKLPISTRQSHLNLDDSCINRGGPVSNGVSTYCKGLMAHLLDTTIPSGRQIHICHACNNSKCSNPKHLYWGTPSENSIDRLVNGDTTIWQKMVLKYGIEEASKINSSRKKGNVFGSGNKGTKKLDKTKKLISDSLKETNKSKDKSIEKSYIKHFNCGKKRETIKYPHCSKDGSISLMHRWHFDNCKNKNITELTELVDVFV